MTPLAHATSGDDFPLAACKHAQDARKLLDAARCDGAAYLAGYAVECAAKAVILLDRAYNSATRLTDHDVLNQWHQRLRNKPYGHALLKLVTETLGPNGQRYAHLLPSTNDAIVSQWTETLRYREEHVTKVQAQQYVASASKAENVIVRMRLDGVL